VNTQLNIHKSNWILVLFFSKFMGEFISIYFKNVKYFRVLLQGFKTEKSIKVSCDLMDYNLKISQTNHRAALLLYI